MALTRNNGRAFKIPRIC